MVRDGLILSEPSVTDSRQKAIALSQYGRDLLPRLQACWNTVKIAADSLDADLPCPLSETLESAIQALAVRSFGSRIELARQSSEKPRGKRMATPWISSTGGT